MADAREQEIVALRARVAELERELSEHIVAAEPPGCPPNENADAVADFASGTIVRPEALLATGR